MENGKETILLSYPRALPKLEPRVLARKVSSLGVGEREGDIDNSRDNCSCTLSPQEVLVHSWGHSTTASQAFHSLPQGCDCPPG